MTDRTDNRLYPYPECDPPLVKDRSDISVLRDLAEAVNTDAGVVDSRIVELMEKPDTARVSFSGSITSTGLQQDLTFPFNTVVFDNTAGSTAVAANGLRARERGWYLVASTVRCTNAATGSENDFLIRHLRDHVGNSENRRFEGTARPVTAAGDTSMSTVDVLLLEAGSLVTTQLREENVPGAFNWEGHLTMVQMLKLDV